MAEKLFKTMLVGIEEPGERRQPGLQRAAQIAARTGSRLVLFHCLFNAYAVGPGNYGKRVQNDIRKLMASRKAALRKHAGQLRNKGLRVSVNVAWDYPPFEAIVREALRIKADLVVAETHRHMRGARLFLTNNDWQLIRLCPAPLLLVKKERAYGRARVLAAIDPMHPAAKAPNLDKRILEMGQAFADAHGGRLDAMYAYTSPYDYAAGLYGETYAAVLDPQLEDEFRTRQERTLKRAVSGIDLPEQQLHIITGTATAAIPKLARSLKADVVVMGALSRQGLDRLFIGNTAERVLDKIPCDVLVVKPRSFRTTVPRRMAKLQFDMPAI